MELSHPAPRTGRQRAVIPDIYSSVCMDQPLPPKSIRSPRHLKFHGSLLAELSTTAAPYGLTATDLTTGGLPIGSLSSLPIGWVSRRGVPHPAGWVQETQTAGQSQVIGDGPTKSAAASASAPVTLFADWGCEGCMGWTFSNSISTPIDPARHVTLSMVHRFTEYLGPHLLVQRWVDKHGRVKV